MAEFPTLLNFGYENVKLFLLQVSIFPEGHVHNIQHFVTDLKKIKSSLFINLPKRNRIF